MMNLIDSHAHLTSKGLAERLDEVLDNAAQAGVCHVITVAGDRSDAIAAWEIARRYSAVSATAGIHPHEAAKASAADVDEIARLLSQPQVVAIGEIGLDYYYDFSDRDSQKRVFSAQLEVAQGLDVPLVVHCREAFDDAIELLCRYGFSRRRVVIHCFSGSATEAHRVTENGWQLSFTGMVTFKNATTLLDIARQYPLDRMMLETDAPYLSPVPVRHVRPNEPANLIYTAKFLAALHKTSIELLAERTTRNAREFFTLS